MKVTKPIDLALLGQELQAAGVSYAVLGTRGTEIDGETDLFDHDEQGMPKELPPEAAPVVAAHDASKTSRTTTFEHAEDAERLALVAERAAEDPAFAALADLTIGRQGV